MKTALSRLTSAVMLVSCLFLFASCGRETQENYELNGIMVSNIQICRLTGDSFNFLVGVSNPSKEGKSFDAGKFILKLESGNAIPHMAGIVSAPADKYELHSFMVSDDHPEMKVGDKVTVYYDGDELCEIKITEIDDRKE
ncbi:MAG: hypothetical protein II722_09845 [Ruminococcus sp.]|nr:hypothetical protein [Ruminococcus sp.]